MVFEASGYAPLTAAAESAGLASTTACESAFRGSVGGAVAAADLLASVGGLSAPLWDTVFALPYIAGGGCCATGVETVRFWFAAGITARLEAGTPGLGGLGGGIFSGGSPDFSIVTLSGLLGSVGRVSPVTSGVSWPLADPSIISCSRSLLLLAIDG